ncbi:MAG: FAD:protein FMN transferase [Sphaerochaetaceae bacterium]|nr:FAD:protein FMN transferase [Sphaerochaetaceae bacterium]
MITLFSCSSEMVSEQKLVFGTVCKITGDKKIPFKEIWNSLEDLENKISMNQDSSELSQVNDKAGIQKVEVSEETYNTVKEALYYSNLTEGYFNPVLGSVIQLWKDGPDFAVLPDPIAIQEGLKHTDVSKIKLTEDGEKFFIYLEDEGMKFDLGGIGKGIAADLVKKILQEHKINSALINLGGNIYGVGHKDNNEKWNIGIQNPLDERGAYLKIVSVDDKSVVTSGAYERNFIKDGVLYHHILDPRTGMSANNGIISSTIINESSTACDALSTACYVMGIDKATKLIKSLKGFEAIFVLESGEIVQLLGDGNENY